MIRYTAPNGATVEEEELFVESKGNERIIAQHLANAGYNVLLLASSSLASVKTPDARLQQADNLELAEFKSITEDAQNIPLAIQRQLRNGKKQAASVIVYINNTRATSLHINQGVRVALFNDIALQELQKITIISYDGRIETLTRKELNDGQRFSLP
jgi:hypothetical protein